MKGLADEMIRTAAAGAQEPSLSPPRQTRFEVRAASYRQPTPSSLWPQDVSPSVTGVKPGNWSVKVEAFASGGHSAAECHGQDLKPGRRAPGDVCDLHLAARG